MLIALRPIEAGEEIRFDYSTTMSDDHWTMECRCGEPICRRVVLDFHHLPPIAQNRYLQLGVVQRFIVRRGAAALAGPPGGAPALDRFRRLSL